MSDTHSDGTSPSITVFLTVLLLVFFFFGFFTIYFCKSFIETLITSIRNTPNSAHLAVGVPVNPPKEGLEHTLIQSFPTFIYASVKDFRKEKYGLECAICLVEFGDDSMLRLLTTCCHVFHQECIDLWLESHKTCPFCRGNLELTSQNILDKSPVLAHENITYEINGHDSVYDLRIDIEDKEEGQEQSGSCDHTTLANDVTCDKELVDQKVIDGENEENNEGERFSRSHSTGHSIVRARSQEEDRYTLRLPENVSIRPLRGHNATGSCTTFGEFSRQGSKGGFGEVAESGSRISGEISKL